jgi:arylamine N-acetyltransferase
MEAVWYIFQLERPATKEGHFLWPRFLDVGRAIFLCRVSWAGPDPQPQNHDQETLAIASGWLRDALADAGLGFREAPAFRRLYPDRQQTDPDICRLVEQLRHGDSSYILEVDPPKGMTKDEMRFYRDNGF